MPSINEVIERVERVKPCDYEDEVKAAWLMELDGKLMSEVVERHRQTEPAPDIPKAFPEDGDKPLLVAAPYDNIYDTYLMAMIDLHRHEIANYNNAMTLYSVALDEWKKQYHRTHEPLGVGGWVL